MARRGLRTGIVNDLQLRLAILRHFAETGRAPDHATLAGWGIDDPTSALQRLHDAHAVVLDENGRIIMANPFSGVPTIWQVWDGERGWFANCAWDAIAIPIALGIDARIEAPWLDGGEVQLSMIDGNAVGENGFIHFEVAAAHWWDDVVHT